MTEEKTKEIKQINSYEFDERFYRKVVDKVDVFAPSVTYVLGAAYPIGYGLLQWKGDVGNKRADEIMTEAGDDGSFVHDAIDQLINGKKILSHDIELRFSPKRSLKIKRCLKSFMDWVEEYKPEFISNEYIVWNEKENYAGTVDLYCKIGEDNYFVDFKTSKSIHIQHKVQVVAYSAADKREGKCAILHLGNTTKKRYSWLVAKDEDVPKYWDQFLKTNSLFKTLNPNAHPTNETYPEYFKIIKDKK